MRGRKGEIALKTGELIPIGLMAVGAASLCRNARLLGAAICGLVIYDLVTGAPRRRRREPPDERPEAVDPVDLASEDSFPASDPPGYSGSIAGGT